MSGHVHRDASLLDSDRLTLGPARGRLLAVGVVLGIAGLGAAAWLGLGDPESRARLARSYLLALTYFLSLTLGALWFLPLQHVTGSSWSVVIRRVAEAIAGAMPALLVLAVPVWFLIPDLYPWAGPEAAGDHLLHHKAGYLSPLWFAVRLVVCFAVWIVLGSLLRCWSLRQDRDGDPAWTRRSARLSGPALVLYGLTLTVAAFDLLMSLDPHWYSTMFGVYYFAGTVVAFFALMTVATFALQRSGRMSHAVTVEHYNDYGRAMFAFVFFWAYIAFSQYMLIWYANIPEETIWYLHRQQHGWGWIGLALILLHWLIPFAGLMSRFTKRRVRLMVFWAVWILAMHWVDLYWLIMPDGHGGAGLAPALTDLAATVGVGGFWLAAVVGAAGDRPLVPLRDPRLEESLNFENY